MNFLSNWLDQRKHQKELKRQARLEMKAKGAEALRQLQQDVAAIQRAHPTPLSPEQEAERQENLKFVNSPSGRAMFRHLAAQAVQASPRPQPGR